MGYGYGTSDARGYVNARDLRPTRDGFINPARVQTTGDAMVTGIKPDNTFRQCDGIVSRRGIVGQCKRRAVVEYDVRDRRGTVAYCKAHDNGAGVMRLLRPFPWETTDRKEL